MKKVYTLRVNADSTISIIVGRSRESISIYPGIERGEIFDKVKWALVSKDAFVSDARLTEDLYEMVWRHTIA